MRYLLLIAPLLMGCPPPDLVVPPPNPPVDTDWCGRMCEHLKGLGCEEGSPVYNNDLPGPLDVPNQTCEDWCMEMQDPEHLYFINPKCLSEVPSCDKIETYRQKDPQTCGVETKTE
jgi:hypothetical protein